MRFDSDKHLERYYGLGVYPKIHDDIYYLDRYVRDLNVLDVGCCYGLLSARLADTHKVVVGVEPSARYLSKAIRRDNIHYMRMAITEDTLPELSKILREYNIQAAYMRRVIPEIWETGGYALVNGFIGTLAVNNVQRIVVEGRKTTRNHINPLYKVEKEIEACGKYYGVIARFRNCAVLEINNAR